MALKKDATVCSACFFLFLLIFFFFGSTDGKGVTHKTSVWLPERVGSGSALSEARRGSSAWSQWVTDPLTDHVQLGDTPLEKHNKPASSCLPETNTCNVLNGTLSPIFGASQVTCGGEKKKKKARRCLQSWKWYPDALKTGCKSCAYQPPWLAFVIFFKWGHLRWTDHRGAACRALLLHVSNKEWWRTRAPTSWSHNGGVYCLLHCLESHPSVKDAHGGHQGNHEGGQGDMSVGTVK